MAEAKNTETTEAPAPAGETKLEKFKRLAPGRVDKTVQAVRQVANLFSPNYEATPELTKQIMEYLNAEFNKLNEVAAGQKEAASGGFSFASTEATAAE